MNVIRSFVFLLRKGLGDRRKAPAAFEVYKMFEDCVLAFYCELHCYCLLAGAMRNVLLGITNVTTILTSVRPLSDLCHDMTIHHFDA